jgi:hypothetical protein
MRCLWLNEKKRIGMPGPVDCWQKGKRINKKECPSCLLAVVAGASGFKFAARRPPRVE